MTSTSATCHASAQTPACAGAGVRTPGVIASMTMRKLGVDASRSPAQGPPASR